MASIQEQMEALNKQEQYILEHPDTREGAMEAQQYSLKKIKEKQQELSKVLGIGPSGTTRDIIDVYKQTNQKGPIPDFYSEAEDIDLLRQWESEGIRGINLTPEFKELDPNPFWSSGQYDVLKDILDNLDPKYEPYRNILQRKLDHAKSGRQISFLNPSSSQYLMNQHLMNQQKNLGITNTNPWLNTPGVQVASMGNLTGMGIPGIIERDRRKSQAAQAAAAQAAAAKAAAAKAAALAGGAAGASTSSGGGWQPDYSGAVASQQSQAAEAGQTHEQFMSDLDAVMAKGGLVSVNHLTRRL